MHSILFIFNLQIISLASMAGPQPIIPETNDDKNRKRKEEVPKEDDEPKDEEPPKEEEPKQIFPVIFPAIIHQYHQQIF